LLVLLFLTYHLQFKWALAARTAAIFAWLACENNDRIGLILYGHKARCEILAPAMGQASLLKIFNLFAAQGKSLQPDLIKSLQLNQTKSHQPDETKSHQPEETLISTLEDALTVLQKLGQSGALILLLSDFSGLTKKARQHLAYICHHHDVAAIKISDPLERALPDTGIFTISDGYQSSTINCQQKGLQKAYALNYANTLQQQNKIFANYAVRLLNLGTEQNLLEQLRLALHPTTAANRKN